MASLLFCRLFVWVSLELFAYARDFASCLSMVGRVGLQLGMVSFSFKGLGGRGTIYGCIKLK